MEYFFSKSLTDIWPKSGFEFLRRGQSSSSRTTFAFTAVDTYINIESTLEALSALVQSNIHYVFRNILQNP